MSELVDWLAAEPAPRCLRNRMVARASVPGGCGGARVGWRMTPSDDVAAHPDYKLCVIMI